MIRPCLFRVYDRAYERIVFYTYAVQWIYYPVLILMGEYILVNQHHKVYIRIFIIVTTRIRAKEYDRCPRLCLCDAVLDQL